MRYANSFKVNPQEMEVIEKALNHTLSVSLDELHTLPQGAKAETLKANIRRFTSYWDLYTTKKLVPAEIPGVY